MKKEMKGNKIEEKSKLDFTFLPPFAKWIIEHKLEDYVRMQLELSRIENVPLLKHFSHFSELELHDIGKTSALELLEALAANKAEEFIADSVVKWLENQLELVDKYSIVAEDIALVSLIRRQTFRTLLQYFTTDIPQFRKTMVEVDRFTTFSDIAAFNALFQIQHEKNQTMGMLLEEQRQDLLEAQDLAQMGSFYWDLANKGGSHFTPNTLRIFELEQTSNLDSFLEDVHPDDRSKVSEAIQDSFTNGGIYECEYRYLRGNKNKKIWSKGVVQFEQDKPVAIKGTVMDVTYRSNLLEQLRHSETLFKNAEALTHIGHWSWDIITNTIMWSDEMYRIYGLEPQSEAITFERFLSLVHPAHRENRMREIEKALATGEADDYILKIVTPGGEEKILQGKGQVEKNAEGNAICFNGTCQDITKEYALNTALREKEEYLDLLINNAPDAVIVIDDKSIIRLWNPKTEKIFGWSAAEAVGKHLADTIIPDRYREAHLRGIHRFLTTGESRLLNRNVELTAKNKRNEELVVSLTLSTVVQNGQRSFIGFIRDITKEHETQIELKNKTVLLEQKNRELERTNKELESFNYAASHDLQEPLRKIQIFSNRIREDKLYDSDKLFLYLDKINYSAARMQKLIEDLLLFSQTTNTELPEQEADLNILLSEAKNTLGQMIEDTGAQISNVNLPKMRIVPFQIQQVFTNILNNAMKYRREGVSPVIWVGYLVVNGTEIGAGGQNFAKISFADNGSGFDPAFSERLFELFSRLHNSEKYSGTGIGLAICKKIIQNHMGYIKSESDGMTGSTFHIYLPEERIVQ
jgi:PAS domain S-box-containing protein